MPEAWGAASPEDLRTSRWEATVLIGHIKRYTNESPHGVTFGKAY